MGEALSESRVVLLQIRDHEGAATQEQRCFLERTGLSDEGLVTINLLERPDVSVDDVGAANAVLIGGAGAHSVLENHPFTDSLVALVKRLRDEEIPIFGSCFGQQFLAMALGGEVVEDRDNSEVGTFDIELTSDGMGDPLFLGFPRTFPVQLGHNDRIQTLPPDAVVLASSSGCPYQLFRMEGVPIYGSQFHCEMDDSDMRERVLIYEDRYLGSEEERARFEASLRPSPESDVLLGRFIELYA